MSTEKQIEELNLTHEDALRRLKARNEEVERLKEELRKARVERTSIELILDAHEGADLGEAGRLTLEERVRRMVKAPRSRAHYEAIQHAINRAYFGAPFNKPDHEQQAQLFRQRAYDALEAIFHPDAKRQLQEKVTKLEQVYSPMHELVEKVELALSHAHHGATLAVSGKMEEEAKRADSAFHAIKQILRTRFPNVWKGHPPCSSSSAT